MKDYTLRRQHITDNDLRVVEKVPRFDRPTLSPADPRFELPLAQVTGAAQAVAVNSRQLPPYCLSGLGPADF